MNEQHEVTAEQIVIEQYAVEVANLKLQNAQLRLKLAEMQEEETDKED